MADDGSRARPLVAGSAVSISICQPRFPRDSGTVKSKLLPPGVEQRQKRIVGVGVVTRGATEGHGDGPGVGRLPVGRRHQRAVGAVPIKVVATAPVCRRAAEELVAAEHRMLLAQTAERGGEGD